MLEKADCVSPVKKIEYSSTEKLKLIHCSISWNVIETLVYPTSLKGSCWLEAKE